MSGPTRKDGCEIKYNSDGTIHQTYWWDNPGEYPQKGHWSRDFDPKTGDILNAHNTDERGKFNWEGPNFGWHK